MIIFFPIPTPPRFSPLQVYDLSLSKEQPTKAQKKTAKKTSKTKTKQNIKTKQKAPTKRHEASIVFASYSWACGLPWNVVDISNDSPLEKREK